MIRDSLFSELSDLLQELYRICNTLFLVHTDGSTLVLYDSKRNKAIFIYDNKKFSEFVREVSRFANHITNAGLAKYRKKPHGIDSSAINYLRKIYGDRYINDFI